MEEATLVISAYMDWLKPSGLTKERTHGDFEFLDHVFTAVESRRTFTAEQLTIVDHRRFEGMSDPTTCRSSMQSKAMTVRKGSMWMCLVLMSILNSETFSRAFAVVNVHGFRHLRPEAVIRLCVYWAFGSSSILSASGMRVV